MKHLKFHSIEKKNGLILIEDQTGKVWVTTYYPLMADLLIDLLNKEFERVTLQSTDATSNSKQIADEADE